MYSRGVPVVSADIQIKGVTYHYAIGDDITGLIVDAGYKKPLELTGKLAAIELARAVVDDNPDHKVLDNIPMRDWNNPVCAAIDPADTAFMVDSILVEVTEESDEPDVDPIVKYYKVQMSQIIGIMEYTDADTGATYTMVKADEITGELDAATALTAATVDGSAVFLTGGKVVAETTITTGVQVLGMKAEDPFTTYDRMMAEPTTEFDEKVIINAAGKDVVIAGCFFTKNSRIEIQGAQSLTLRNCRFSDLIPDAERCYVITGPEGVSCKVVVENCVFGDNQTIENEDGTTYLFHHVYEGNMSLADGSSFDNNYFARFACQRNPISIYNIDADAVVAVTDNYLEYSNNMLRLGLKGDVTCTINVNRNAARDTNHGYPGLVIIQPYNMETTSFSNMTVNMNGNKQGGFSDRLVYLYADSGDTPFNYDSNYPVVYIDGVLQEDIAVVDNTVVEGSEA